MLSLKTLSSSIVLAAYVGCFFSPSCLAAHSYTLWRTSVLASLTEEEVTSFKKAIRETLERAPDTEIINWTSPDGTKSGKILARFTYRTNGLVCRRASFQVSEKIGNKESYRFDLCKGKEGWAVADVPPPLKSEEREHLDTFLTQTLEFQEDGYPLTWTGEISKYTVVIVPVAKMANQCRLVAVSLSDKEGRTLNGQYRFCKQNGQWQYEPVSN